MSDILPEKHREMFVARARSLRLRYDMGSETGRMEYHRDAVSMTRRLIAPHGVTDRKWARKSVVRQLNEVLDLVPIPHAADAFGRDAPLDAESRHPELHNAFLVTHQLLRQCGVFPARGTVRSFVRQVEVLTPDASHEDRLGIVASALTAYGIAASVIERGSKRVRPGTIYLGGQPVLLPGMTQPQPYDVPNGWTTSYATPLRFEQLSPLPGIELGLDSPPTRG